MIYLRRYHLVLPPFSLGERSHQILFIFLWNQDVKIFSPIHIVLNQNCPNVGGDEDAGWHLHAQRCCVHVRTHTRTRALCIPSGNEPFANVVDYFYFLFFLFTTIYISGHANEVKTNAAPLPSEHLLLPRSPVLLSGAPNVNALLAVEVS